MGDQHLAPKSWKNITNDLAAGMASHEKVQHMTHEPSANPFEHKMSNFIIPAVLWDDMSHHTDHVTKVTSCNVIRHDIEDASGNQRRV